MILSRRELLPALGAAALTTTWPKSAFADKTPLAQSRWTQYVVLNPQTGKIILGHHAHDRRHPASLTKMMTAELVFQAMADPKTDFNLNSMVRIPNFIRVIPSDIAVFEQMGRGDKISAEKLLIGMGSRSDARSTLALAIHLGSPEVYNWGGTEQDKLYRFIAEMNKRAKDIGMNNSHFSVVTGLPYDNHYSTPADMAILMNHLQKEYPKSVEKTFGQPFFDLGPISSQGTHTSRLLKARPKRVQWAKTGYTDEAGYCLAVSYEKEGVPLIGVVFAENSRWGRNRTMLNTLTEAYKIIEEVPFPTPRRRPNTSKFDPPPIPNRKPNLDQQNNGPFVLRQKPTL